MSAYAWLLVKALLVTAVFGALFVAALLFTTLTFQNHIHPDEWTTTGYDIAAGALVVVAYVAVVGRMAYNFWKHRAKKI
jgi:hypothetical protein